MQDDKEIVSRITNGDLYAFKILVKQHERLVTAMVSRIVQADEDVQDICQEVFLKVYKNLPRFKFQSGLSTWIAKIAYTTSLNHIRKYRGKKILSIDLTKFENVYRDSDDTESILIRKNASEFIHKEIRKLPLPYRTVLTLYHLNELSYSEIAETTGMPEGSVKSYLFRARRLLKDKLARYYK